MVNKLVPDYLSDLVPGSISDTSNYNLRNNPKLQSIKCNTSNYSKSFLPDTVNIWNSLPSEITNSNTLGEFKRKLKEINNKPNYLDIYYGSRPCQIIHARLRLGCSDLNGDKFARFATESPACNCGHHLEDALHFFLICPIYHNIRVNSYFYTNGYNLLSILYGNSNSENFELLKSANNFIIKSHRFPKFSE